MTTTQKTYATGRRKTAIARVWLTAGEGKFTINDRSDEDYFSRPTARMVIRQALEEVALLDKYDVDRDGRRRRHRLAGRRHPPRHHARADEDRQRASPEAEGGRLRHPRPPQEGAQEVRPEGRSRSLPVQQALDFAPERFHKRAHRTLVDAVDGGLRRFGVPGVNTYIGPAAGDA